MRFRTVTILAACAAALALPSAAGAAAPLTHVKVRACTLGDAPKARSAVFYARMRAVPGAVRMKMRFTLLDRTSSGSKAVPVRQLTRWRRSRLGVRKFGYAQRIRNLQPGGVYAALVEFRWIGLGGRTIESQRHTSADCRQDGRRPNLTVRRVTAKPGESPGTVVYGVDIANNGAADAHDVPVDVFVDGAAADTKPVDLIEAGETVTLHVTGPTCVRRVRAIVDRHDAIPETTEDDNVLRTGCPATAS